MNHSDNKTNTILIKSRYSPDLIVNVLALLIISGLVYKGVDSCLHISSESMFSQPYPTDPMRTT